MEGLITSVALLFMGLFIGYLKGKENERDRIQRAFSHKDYTYKKFYKVLEDYEALRRNIKNSK